MGHEEKNGRRKRWRGNQPERWADLTNIEKNRLNDFNDRICTNGKNGDKWSCKGCRMIEHDVITKKP